MSLVRFKSSNHPQQVGKRGASDRDNLGTDPVLFAKLDERFHFTLDVCATPENAKCDTFYSKRGNGLELPWKGRVWCNPPYSEIKAWVDKAWQEAGKAELIVMLLPANRTEQVWWQDAVEPFRDLGFPQRVTADGVVIDFRVEFLRGRQRFVMPGAESIGPNERPPFGCCLLIWKAPDV